MDEILGQPPKISQLEILYKDDFHFQEFKVGIQIISHYIAENKDGHKKSMSNSPKYFHKDETRSI